ncbi:hypothetical protein EBB79_11605 [Parasedimentitalea marina]|uniref:Nuclear transport factor 2 family protein n=2 Tax=Parasedimentitalea marina TaxID=2483033 RepID=A0A3T0N388_9RHOB|nr:hypothetical protein EBB79_11605 [Parasedimentitalea marina]
MKFESMNEGDAMTKAETLQYWFDEVWTNGNLSAIDQMFIPGTEANGSIPELSLRSNDYADLVVALRKLAKDIKISFSQVLEQDEWLAVRTVIDAKNADNDDAIQLTGQVFVRFEGIRIAEIHSQTNFFSLFEQLGQIPPDALLICLTGQRLKWT